MKAAVSTSTPPGALDLLKAARDELDAIAAEGRASGAADRLNGVAALIEEAMGQLEGPQR